MNINDRPLNRKQQRNSIASAFRRLFEGDASEMLPAQGIGPNTVPRVRSMNAHLPIRRIAVALAVLIVSGCGVFNSPSPDLTHRSALLFNAAAHQIIRSGGADLTPGLVLSNVAAVSTCASAPDGRSAVLSYQTGGSNADQPWHLILISGGLSTAPRMLGDNAVDLCKRGGVAFTADSTQLAYLDGLTLVNPTGNPTVGLPVGTFHLITAGDGRSRATLDQVAAFDLEPGGLFVLRASQTGITVMHWPSIVGTGALPEPIPLGKPIPPSAGCVWTAAQVRAIGASHSTGISATGTASATSTPIPSQFAQIVVALDAFCATAPTIGTLDSQVYTVDTTSGALTNVYDHPMPGTIAVPFDDFNALAVTTDGQFAMLTVPNGTAPGISDLVEIGLTQPSQAPFAVLNNVYDTRSLIDPTRRTWVVIGKNAGGGQTLYGIDLSQPSQPAQPITDDSRSSSIGTIAWDAAGRRLIFVYSGAESELGFLDLSGTLRTLISGNFHGAAIDAAGKIGLTIGQDSGAPIAVSIPDGASRTWFTPPANSDLVPLVILTTS